MRVFKTRWFARYARKEGIDDKKLAAAILEAEYGQIDADYGGGLIKKRIAREGAGKSGGYRTLIAYKSASKSLFLYCFAKSDKENIADSDVKEYKKFARLFLAFNDAEIATALHRGAIEEVTYYDKKL